MLIKIGRRLYNEGYEVEILALPLYRKNIDISGFLDGIHYNESWFHLVDTDVAYMVYAPLVSNFFLTDSPKIAGIHGFLPASDLSSREAIKLKPAEFYKRYGLIFTISNYYYKFFKLVELKRYDALHLINPFMSFHHKKKYYVPNFLDTEFYKPYKKDDEFTVLFTGRHEWSKGWDEYLKYCHILDSLGYKIKFLCTGKGEGVVKGVGFVEEEDLPKLYSRAHLTVYLTRIDTFGLVIAESLSCGTPVITSPIPAHKGLYLPVTYATSPEEAVAKTIKYLHLWENKRHLYERISERGVKMVKSYDQSKILPSFIDMLEEVAEG
jgi:glycosyltransferase involved in cell wall biosynthesis